MRDSDPNRSGRAPSPGMTRDQHHGTCAVAPSPQLQARWIGELASARERRRRGSVPLRREGEPNRLGFNDGVIIPPWRFAAGTPERTIRAAAADRAPLRGQVRVAVVLVDFPDKEMTRTSQHFTDLFFSTGVLPNGSVKEYYLEVTSGLVEITGTVVGTYRMPHTLAWYANDGSGIGLNDTAFRSPTLALDAATRATADLDFAPYDNDHNGYVDAMIVVHAGAGAEQTGALGDIWSHKSVLDTAFTTDGTAIYGYLTIPEDARIGVSAHELGHLLFGFPDLYDPDGSSEGVGNWCLMGGGSWNGDGDIPSHPSAWCKVNQGWADATIVTADAPLAVSAVESSREVFRLWRDGSEGSEYFLLENRQQVGFDRALPGSGLLLWHVDDAKGNNADELHYKVGLVQADGLRDLERGANRGDPGDPFPGSSNTTSVSGSTTPDTLSYAGATTCVALGSIPDSAATMNVTAAVRCLPEGGES